MSIFDVMIGISILGFFVAFLPQVLIQSQRQSQRATIKTDLTRLRQILLIGARNVDRIKKDVMASVPLAKRDEFMNCFGVRGPGQPKSYSGVDEDGNPYLVPHPKGFKCDEKFPSVWTLLTEVGSPMFNKKWTLKSECVAPEICMLETSAWYYVSCEQKRCNSIHLLVGMKPTVDMLALQNKGAGENLSSDDFVEKKTEIIFPGTIFGSNNALTTEKCSDPNTFLEFLSADYNQFYCNPDMANKASCGTSVLNLNGGCGSSSAITDARVVAGTFSSGGGPVSALSTAGKLPTDSMAVTLCAKPEGTHGFMIDPMNPGQTIPKPFPNFSLADKVQISCGPALPQVTFLAVSDSETPPPQYCKTVSVLASTLGAYVSIDCVFEVLTSANAQIGNAGTATLKINPALPGVGSSGPLPSATPSTAPVAESEANSGEI